MVGLIILYYIILYYIILYYIILYYIILYYIILYYQQPSRQPDILQNPEFYHLITSHHDSLTSYKTQNFIMWSTATTTAWHPTKPRTLSRDQQPPRQADILQNPELYHVINSHHDRLTSYKTQNFITWSTATATAWHPTKCLLDPKQKNNSPKLASHITAPTKNTNMKHATCMGYKKL